MDEQSDRDEQSDEEERAPERARPDGRAPPTPARNGPPRPPPTRPRDNRRHQHADRGRKRDGQANPPPARAFGGSGGPPNGDVDAAEAVLDSGGRTWAVRVLGRSGGGRARSGGVPLLLLGFWEDGRDGERPALEAIVVGRTLAELASDRLEAALAEARPPR
jgi:hypothetical protein